MKKGYIGRPPQDIAENAIREDFKSFINDPEVISENYINVVFGFAWGNAIYESDWVELRMTGSELYERVKIAEAQGLGSIGTDDLYIVFPRLGVEVQYCHEADIHITAKDTTHPYVVKKQKEWLKKRWEVIEWDDA